jgi:hypothetical protein
MLVDAGAGVGLGEQGVSSIVKVWFGSVRFKSQYLRMPNLNLRSVQAIPRTLNLNHRFRFNRFGSAFKGVQTPNRTLY